MSKSKSARKRSRAKKLRASKKSRGKKKKIRHIFNHLTYCPPSTRWWVSNDPDWAPEITCPSCRLKYRPHPQKDVIEVAGMGQFPLNPTVLDLLGAIS